MNVNNLFQFFWLLGLLTAINKLVGLCLGNTKTFIYLSVGENNRDNVHHYSPPPSVNNQTELKCFSSLRIQHKIEVYQPTGLNSIYFLKAGKETSHTVAKFEIFLFINGKKAHFKSFHSYFISHTPMVNNKMRPCLNIKV